MDPFSVTAGAFGILAALVQCTAKTCELIDSWKEAPKDFLQLEEECKALKAVLMDVMEAQKSTIAPLTKYNTIDTAGAAPPTSSALNEHIKKAEGVLSSLQLLITGLRVCDAGGIIQVKRFKFMGDRKKIKTLRRDINSLNVSFGTLLVVRIL
jgi:hypothetical protein